MVDCNKAHLVEQLSFTQSATSSILVIDKNAKTAPLVGEKCLMLHTQVNGAQLSPQGKVDL